MTLTTRKIKAKSPLDYFFYNLDAILISLVLNINVLRFFLGITDTNILLYMLYLTCIVVLYCKNKKNIIRAYFRDVVFRYNIWFWIIFIVYSIVSCVLITYELGVLFKFLVAIIIGVLCIGEDIEKKKVIFKYYIIVNIIYGIIILKNPSSAYSYIGENVNYLNMTLTLGLCFTLCLVQAVYNFFSSEDKHLFLPIILSVFFFAVMMLFSGRGVLLFPPIIALYIALFGIKRNGKYGGKLIIFLIALAIVCMLAIQYFQQNASEFALIHMSRLFEDTGEESRFTVWHDSIAESIDRLWIFFGAGFNGFGSNIGYYPHNIFMQVLFDFGVFIFFGFVGVIYYVFKRFFREKKSIKSSKVFEIQLMCFASFLYYLLTFCKSFSMYDSCPLIIMIYLCLSNILKVKNETQI